MPFNLSRGEEFALALWALALVVVAGWVLFGLLFSSSAGIKRRSAQVMHTTGVVYCAATVVLQCSYGLGFGEEVWSGFLRLAWWTLGFHIAFVYWVWGWLALLDRNVAAFPPERTEV